MSRIITLDEFIIKEQENYITSTGKLSRLLRYIGMAAKIVNREVNKAGLADILGEAGEDNMSGDTVQKLDIYADQIFIECVRSSGECCGIASEEDEGVIELSEDMKRNSEYVLVMDPLDGSSNIDVNVSVGTIFGIYNRATPKGEPCNLNDFFQSGAELVASGYVLYGSSTMVVYTTGNGVNGFTLDPSIGEFCLSHPDMKIPANGSSYSVNQGNYSKFNSAIKHYIKHCERENYSLRYIGSMVSDLHRILIKGGLFMYPGTTSHPNGKLRLVYECNPMAHIIENAGGKAITTENEEILHLDVNELHQRTTIAIGSPDMVDEMKTVMAEVVETV